MREIFLLTDYKGFFGSKWKASPYRSGYDQQLLSNYFKKYEFSARFMRLADVNFKSQDWNGKVVLYTSSEEIDYNYKQYIEDIIYALELAGTHVIPYFKFLRANNNKVFMEILRDQILGEKLSGLSSKHFGTFEELERAINQEQVQFPCVIKSATGAMSKGVKMAKNINQLRKSGKQLSRSPHYYYEFKDFVRTFKHNIKGYLKESSFQNKFIIQPFVAGLPNDWKVLVYSDQYYLLKRHVHPNDFRASGSGLNYKAGSESEIPFHMLDYAENIYKKLDVPHLSFDLACDEKRGYVIEIQAVFFGTATQYLCKDYFAKVDGEWKTIKKTFDQEEAYVWGIVKYLKNHPEFYT